MSRAPMAYGHIKDGETTVVLPSSDDQYRHIMRLVSRYGREKKRAGSLMARIGQDATVEEWEAQDERAHEAFTRVAFAVRWATDR